MIMHDIIHYRFNYDHIIKVAWESLSSKEQRYIVQRLKVISCQSLTKSKIHHCFIISIFMHCIDKTCITQVFERIA